MERMADVDNLTLNKYRSMLEKHRKQQLEYFKKYNPSCLCRDGFINGKFNPDNWCGGDLQLIRDYFYNIELSNNWKRYFEADYIEGDKECMDAIIVFDRYNQQAYCSIIVRILMSDLEEHFDQYLFSWYKNEGNIEVAFKNGRYITEEEYIELLRILKILK